MMLSEAVSTSTNISFHATTHSLWWHHFSHSSTLLQSSKPSSQPRPPPAWTLLYMFLKCIMYATVEKKRKDVVTLTKSVKIRLARWRRGGEEYKKLWTEALRNTTAGSKGKKKAVDDHPTVDERNGQLPPSWPSKASTRGRYGTCSPRVPWGKSVLVIVSIPAQLILLPRLPFKSLLSDASLQQLQIYTRTKNTTK